MNLNEALKAINDRIATSINVARIMIWLSVKMIDRCNNSSDNNIGDEGAKSIAAALEKIQSVTYINLGG